jgi:hypothetical protein
MRFGLILGIDTGISRDGPSDSQLIESMDLMEAWGC